jgi:SAM-dependent methyltransferase/uncharacterized protein YbaR (Trm112 family)
MRAMKSEGQVWSRIVDVLQCPVCAHALELHAFKEERIRLAADHIALAHQRGVMGDDFNRYIDAGLLLCSECGTYYPILHGLPILIPYTTPIHHEFHRAYRDRLGEWPAYLFARLDPVSGEQFVMESFSAEWLDYDYDGTIWDLSYEDHEKRLLAELGTDAASHGQGKLFLAIGCGIGLSTFFAQKNLRGDALGVDLSLAGLQAAKHFRTNPFLHFAQGSAFYLPVRSEIADVIYSHGVLHHTYDPRRAVISVARCAAPDAWYYVWVYGSGSLQGSPARRVAWQMERIMRPVIARHLSSPMSSGALATVAVAYLAINRLHRLRDGTVESYNYRQALHAARDRFTPLYAFRHDYPEVAAWFVEAGFVDVQEVDWRTMPTANQDNYRRNTGVRGRRR